MGIFDKRKEKDREKADSPLWMAAYMPSYSFMIDGNGNPSGGFALNEGILSRFLKKPSEYYEETDRFVMVLISSTDKKVIGELPYDKALKALEAYKQDETKDELLVRPLTYQEITGLLK